MSTTLQAPLNGTAHPDSEAPRMHKRRLDLLTERGHTIPSLPQKLRVAFVSPYPPTKCGLAAFTQDLVSATKTAMPESEIGIVAIDKGEGVHPTQPEVVFRVDQDRPDTYLAAARFLNHHADVVSVQHDFGVFGIHGPYLPYLQQDYLAPFLQELKVPVVVTLHAVPPHAHPTEQASLLNAVKKSAATVVMSKTAASMLIQDYCAPAEKVVYLPFGVPDINPLDRQQLRSQRAVSDRIVVTTFGLISGWKGLEYAIRAITRVALTHTDVVYLIIGQTHPEVLRREGESYRRSLQALIEDLDASKHVQFVNRYLSRDEIAEYLVATDVYVTPYPNYGQTGSYTLNHALAAGKAIVSTPYIYAAEVLADGRGVLADFRSAESLANAICSILDKPDEKRRLERNAYAYGRSMAWTHVGQDFAALLRDSWEGKPLINPHLWQSLPAS